MGKNLQQVAFLAKKKRPPKKQTKVKKLHDEAAAQEQGRIEGQYKAHKKKPWMESLKEHLGHWIDNIDPLEVAVIGAATLIIHDVLLKSEVRDKILALTPIGILGVAGIPYSMLITFFQETFGFGRTPKIEPNEQNAWLVSFVVAFIVVKYGGSVLGQTASGLAKILLA